MSLDQLGGKMPRKPGLTIERHRSLGLELARTSDNLTHIAVELSRAYPHLARHCTAIGKAIDALSTVRCSLDSALAVEHPSEFATTVYFPHQATRTAAPELLYVSAPIQHTTPPTPRSGQRAMHQDGAARQFSGVSKARNRALPHAERFLSL
jgi:hypothetical protein